MASRIFPHLSDGESLFKSYVNRIFLMAKALPTGDEWNPHSRKVSFAAPYFIAQEAAH